VTTDFRTEAELTLFLRMRAKEIASPITGKMYRRVIPLLQEIEVAGANGGVRFLIIVVSAHAQLK